MKSLRVPRDDEEVCGSRATIKRFAVPRATMKGLRFPGDDEDVCGSRATMGRFAVGAPNIVRALIPSWRRPREGGDPVSLPLLMTCA
jgi:hypothetical protein